MSKEAILIIEDEKNILELVKYNLEKEGFRVSTASDGEEGLKKARGTFPDLVVLDLMLPEIDGRDVCKILRQNPRTAHIPIVMLTARSEEVDKILGLELGADDYVTKPFSPRELAARIRAVLRRSDASRQDPFLEAGSLRLDPRRHVVTVEGKPVSLTSKEYGLLKELMASDGRVLSREDLLEKVWGLDRAINIETRTVDIHIGQLRKKLKPEAFRIITVKNAGYRFEKNT